MKKSIRAFIMALCFTLLLTSYNAQVSEAASPEISSLQDVEMQEVAMAELAASNDITIMVGQTITLTCGTYQNAYQYQWVAMNSSGQYVWDSSRSDIVSVDAMGGRYNKSTSVRGLKAGTTTVKCNITAYNSSTLNDVNYQNSWNITVLPNSGSAGSNITWTYSDNKLSIRGTGAMYNYTRSQDGMAPWLMYQSLIKTIEVSDSVTGIGNYAFDSLNEATTVRLGNDVSKIGEGSFLYCTSLSSITLPEGIKSIPGIAFGQCTSLKQITIPASVETIEYGAFYGCTLNSVRYGGSKRQWKRIQIGEENSTLSTVTIQYLGGDDSLTIAENFDDRTSGSAVINCDNPTLGDFTIASDKPCIVLRNDGTNYIRMQAEKVNDAENEYGFTLPDDYDETIKIIVAVFCDFDGDGSVTSVDAQQILQFSANGGEIDDIGLKIADVNEDGHLTSTDALQVLRVTVGLRSISW